MTQAPKIIASAKFKKHNYILNKEGIKQQCENIRKASHVDVLEAGRTIEGEYIVLKVYINQKTL